MRAKGCKRTRAPAATPSRGLGIRGEVSASARAGGGAPAPVQKKYVIRTRGDRGSEEPSVERERKEILEAVRALRGFEICELDFEVAAELPENLTARAARRRRRIGVGDDRDAHERAMALWKCLGHRDALG